MKWFLHRARINAILITTILLLILLSFISYYQIRKINDSYGWVIHSYQIINVTNTLMMNVERAVGTQRGFVMTKKSEFLVGYKKTIGDIDADLNNLRKLTIDNPFQIQRTQELANLLKQRLLLIHTMIKLTQANQAHIAIANTAKLTGEKLTQDIRTIVTSIVNDEYQLLIKRINISFDSVNRITMFVLFANLLSFALIVFSFILLNRHLAFKIDAENKLLQSEHELLKLAYRDPLTGLFNRAFLIKQIDETLANNEIPKNNLGLLLIDIDNFKVVNDSLGYETGDKLIKLFGERLTLMTRTTDIVTRIGSDQFILMIKDTDEINDLNKVAQKILKSTTTPFHINEHNIYLTVSIGISVAPLNGVEARILLKNADIAMYRAKELGKNNYQFCTPEMILEVEEQAYLDYKLHQAVVNKEFILLYQPKISLHNGQMIGVEALIRWNNPDQGLIYPTNFISLAESNGLIVPIGEWMLRTACEQGVEWQNSNKQKFHIAINISPLQFILSDIVSTVKNILAETGFNPEFLELEITENIWLRNSFNNLVALRELKEMGIKITIDDFGTGFSSLSYLSTFPIDKLKIDQSFVNEIIHDSSDHSLINAIIVMAHSLKIQVVAEGVESEYQINVLKKLHCDEVQGFYYSHPITAAQISKFH